MEAWLKHPLVRRLVPPLAGLLFFALFVKLGFWQLDRAAEKNELLAKFATDGPYAEPHDFESLAEYERITVAGRFDGTRQVLIDNVPRDGRLGAYVVTPFKPATNDPLLLVNRGWLQKTGPDGTLPDLSVDRTLRHIHGLTGHLPRVGIRPGTAFEDSGDWPKRAVYPTPDEIAQELGEPVLPVVLLLEGEPGEGFEQSWMPNVSGPMTHYGYAVQWFAMAAGIVAIAAWQLRGRRR